MSYDAVSNTLVTSALDDTVKFIDAQRFVYTHEVKMDSQPQGVDFGQTGLVVVACIKNLVIIRNKQKVFSMNIDYEASSVSVSKTLGQVAVGGKDNKVHIYQLNGDSLAEVKTLPERDFITAVRYSHNDAYLAVADNAKNVKCYSTTSDYVDITRDLWQHHAGRITALAWSPDSSHLATSSVDTHCIIYSPSKTSDYIQIKNAHPLNPLTSCDWLDNNHLITSSQDCCLRKWKINF